MLHQPFLVSFQRLHFPSLRSDQVVQRTQAVRDLPLLGGYGMTCRGGKKLGDRNVESACSSSFINEAAQCHIVA
ncbi:MAG: hypothetical protein ACK55I_05140, partial [bacterium]